MHREELIWVHASAPVRFCDLGGFTDTDFCGQGAVLNFASTLRVYVSLLVRKARSTQEAEQIRIISHDTNEVIALTGEQLLDDAHKGVLDLFQAALHQSPLTLRKWAGVYGTTPYYAELHIRSDAPVGSGLGTSAAAGVAALAALSYHLNGTVPHSRDIARHAQELETKVLKLKCGVQDQIVAALGGILFMLVNYPNATVEEGYISGDMRNALNQQFVLIHTGISHFSSKMHEGVEREFLAGRTVQQFEKLVDSAYKGKTALKESNILLLAEAMNDNWTAQKALHPEITTPEIEGLHEAVSPYILGFKVNGAGGGGTVTILARNGMTAVHAIRKEAEALGMQILPSRIGYGGVQVWKTTEVIKN